MGKASIAFASEMDEEWVEMMGGVRDAVIYIGTEGLAKVTEKSPVAAPETWKVPRNHRGGTFQNNWIVSVGKPDESTTETLGAFAGKNAGALAAYAAADGFPVIYLQNNLPYALRIENGWSRQAPAGVVAMTVAELELIWQGLEV